MSRLFIALEFPDRVKDHLLKFQPALEAGVKNIPREQVHLTLHFLGEQEEGVVLQLLSPLEFPAFELSLVGLGTFAGRNRSNILWAGVAASPPLIELHQRLGEVLRPVGYLPEARPYHPHVTLARLSRAAQDTVLEHFLHRASQVQLTDIPVGAFALLRSTLSPTGPEYEVVRRVGLRAK